MESKNELKEIDIKNRTCFYFDGIIRFWDRYIDFSEILLEEKLYNRKYENILIYDILYKTSTWAKPLRIRFDKIDGFIKIDDKVRYLLILSWILINPSILIVLVVLVVLVVFSSTIWL